MESEQISSLPEGLCRQFTIDEILVGTHNFSDSLVIGQGGFAKVYKGEIDNGRRTVAIKKLNSMSPKLRKEFRDEILMVSKFRHSHLVSMLGYCETDVEMILVYEYVAGGTLDENLHKLGRAGSSKRVPLCWIERLKIGIGVARGLDYLHNGTGINNKVIHRDIKSSNILLDENRGTAKIADFGLSKIGPANQLDTHVSTRIAGTIGYLDPDYACAGLLTSKSDVYSFGVVLFELLSGRPAVDSKLDDSQRGLAGWARVCVSKKRVENIIDTSLKSEMQPRCLSKYVKISERCLNERPKERPTMTEVLAELVLALSLQETGKLNGSLFSKKILEFLSVKPRPISDNNAVDHAMEAAATDHHAMEAAATYQKDKLLVDISHKLIAPILVGLYELKEITNVFSKKASIGGGSNASEYYGIFYSEGPAAITKLDRQNFSKQAFIPRSLDRIFFSKEPFRPDDDEAFIPRARGMDDTEFTVVRVKHENVVELLGYCVSHNRHFLVYEHASNGSLHNLLHGICGAQPGARLSWSQRVKIAVGAAKGLQYLHQMAQIHQAGINSRNIFVFDNDVAKIVDIEFILDFDEKFFSQLDCMDPCGETYRRPPYPDSFDEPDPPERIWRETSQSNVYSFGVVLLELLTGRSSFSYKLSYGEEKNLVKHVRRKLNFNFVDRRLNGEYPRKAVAKMAAVAESCLEKNFNLRPNMDTVVEDLQCLL